MPVQHIVVRPAQQGQAVFLVQAVVDQGGAGDVLVVMPGLYRAAQKGRGRRVGLALLLQRGLQGGRGVFGLKAQQASVHGAVRGRGRHVAHIAAPDHTQPSAVGLHHPGLKSAVGLQPVAPHLDLGRLGVAVFQQACQQCRRFGAQQQGRSVSAPEFVEGAQQVGRIDRHGRLGRHAQLHARQLAVAAPQGAVAEGDAAEDGLDHSGCYFRKSNKDMLWICA